MKNRLFFSDSIDLLLDAMCNVFGVVLLMAIILGGISASRQITSSDRIDSRQMQQAQNESALLASQLQAAQSQRELLQSLLGKSDLSGGLVPIDHSLQDKHRKLVIEVNKYADKIEDISSRIAKEKMFQARLKNSSVEQEKALIARLKNTLAAGGDTPVAAYGLAPAKHLTPWRIMIDPEKFYIIGTNQDIYQGGAENSGVTVSSFKYGKIRFFQIRKVPDKGFLLQDFSPDRLIDQDKNFVELSVTGNAIAAAAAVIAELRKHNIAFIWQIVPEEGMLLRTAERGNYVVSY